MKSYLLYIMLIFSIQYFSYASYQNIDNNRIYNENEVDLKPRYPGGVDAMKKFVKRNLVWPDDYGNNGVVIVSATITKDGYIVDAKVIRTLCVFCDKEALEVLKKMPKWSPGKLNKRRVNTNIRIPIRFEISE